MTTDPIILFPHQLAWTPVSASISATIGAKTAVGGYGLIGWGRLSKAVYLMGDGGGVPGAGESNYGWAS